MPRNSLSRTTVGVIAMIVLASRSVWGDPVIVAKPGMSSGGLSMVEIDVDPNGATFDTINVNIAGSNFHQAGGASFVVPGSDDTGFLLNMTIGGFTSFAPMESAEGLTGVWASLGNKTISSTTINLAQIVFSSGSLPSFGYTFQFADEGMTVATVSGSVPTAVPEAASSIYTGAIALLFGLGIVGSRWRGAERKPGR